MYSIRCIMGAVLAAALTCVAADAAVFTGGGAGVNPNAEYDTYVGQAPSGSVDTWEISLPANTYYVTIACGDPSAATGPHYVALSGDGSTYSQVAALNTATDANEYVTATNVPVTVTPGAEKLSLRLGGNSVANRINFIIISEDLLHNSTVCASTSYSDTQDQDHWTYNYWNGATYGDLTAPVDGKTWTYSGGRPNMKINNSTPGGAPGALLDSVRSWTAPFDDTVDITGWALRANDPGLGDGVTLRVYKQATNGTRTEIMSPITISNSDTAYHPYSITGVNILSGEKIRFHVDPIGNSNYDSTQFNAVVASSAYGAAYAASNGFSDTQGLDNWTYEYFNGSTYTNLDAPVDGKTWTMGGARPNIKINNGSPGGVPGALLHAARTWTAPSTGVINISGWALRANEPGLGDGVTVKIIRNNETASPLLSEPIGNSDTTYHRFTVNSVSVTAGDKLHFNVDPNANANYDSTQFDAVIQYQS